MPGGGAPGITYCTAAGGRGAAAAAGGALGVPGLAVPAVKSRLRSPGRMVKLRCLEYARFICTRRGTPTDSMRHRTRQSAPRRHQLRKSCAAATPLSSAQHTWGPGAPGWYSPHCGHRRTWRGPAAQPWPRRQCAHPGTAETTGTARIGLGATQLTAHLQHAIHAPVQAVQGAMLCTSASIFTKHLQDSIQACAPHPGSHLHKRHSLALALVNVDLLHLAIGRKDLTSGSTRGEGGEQAGSYGCDI